MKRNTRSLLKFVALAAITAAVTVFLFRLVRSPYSYEGYTGAVVHQEGNGALPIEPEEAALVINDLSKIDWHDYEAIKLDSLRQGIGEGGKVAHLTAAESDKYDALFKVNGFNAALSDKIALDRSIPDIRHIGCRSKKYLKHLGTVSIIIPFHNEHWTTLLRTIYSVINRSPPQLLKEIILVDDFSSKAFSKKPLDDYIASNLTKVQLIHLPERLGLIRARIAGAEAARGNVLIFLDSHTEANVNWLPPLLEPIAQDYRTCTCPFIDVIQYDTFEYRSQDEGARGAFDWEFFYKRLPLLPEDLQHPTEPFKSPVMAGGLFAISRKFFWELGGYDKGLDIWGGEQYELSFKIWQCGGQMFDVPCSRIGHIYRKYAPFPNPRHGDDFVGKNYKRVAEVWMDEYAEYLYKRRPHYRDMDPGDLSEQLALRQKLKCKPFKWFMEEVAFDLPLRYPPIEPEDFASGEIRSIAAPELCADSGHKQRDGVLQLKLCIKGTGNNGEQNFTLTWHKDIRPAGRTLCWDVSDPRNKADITLYPCHGSQGNQYWKYDVEKQWIVHGGNPRCLDCDPGSKILYVTACDENAKTQKWRFESINLKRLSEWDNVGPA